MAIPLIVGAIILFAAAYQNNLQYLIANLEQDVGGYFKWLIALMAIAAIGLIPKAKPVATSLLVLVILVILIGNKEFFTNIKNIQGSIVAPPAPKPVSPADVAPGSGGGAKQVGAPVATTDKQGGSDGSSSIGGVKLSPFGQTIVNNFPTAVQNTFGVINNLLGFNR